jgi:hypothetical protein
MEGREERFPCNRSKQECTPHVHSHTLPFTFCEYAHLHKIGVNLNFQDSRKTSHSLKKKITHTHTHSHTHLSSSTAREIPATIPFCLLVILRVSLLFLTLTNPYPRKRQIRHTVVSRCQKSTCPKRSDRHMSFSTNNPSK